MSKDKAEEKAREYAESVVDSTVENYMGEEIFNSQIDFISQCYLAGYNSLSTDNAQLREALREVISRYEILERSVMVHPDYVFGDDNDEWHTFIDCGKEPLNEAKQLLTDNTQDNENN